VAEDLEDQRLRATLQFKAVGLSKDESLEIQINGSRVPGEHITRVLDPDGQNRWRGRVMAPFYLYIIDLNWEGASPPIINGDNQLQVHLVSGETSAEERVTIEELEVYVYVRRE
jgi:hypothetical protein